MMKYQNLFVYSSFIFLWNFNGSNGIIRGLIDRIIYCDSATPLSCVTLHCQSTLWNAVEVFRSGHLFECLQWVNSSQRDISLTAPSDLIYRMKWPRVCNEFQQWCLVFRICGVSKTSDYESQVEFRQPQWSGRSCVTRRKRGWCLKNVVSAILLECSWLLLLVILSWGVGYPLVQLSQSNGHCVRQDSWDMYVPRWTASLCTTP